MKIVLNDTEVSESLYPFAVVKPVADIRVGILTFSERWKKITGEEIFATTTDFFSSNQQQPDLLFPANLIITKAWWQLMQDALKIAGNGGFVDSTDLIKTIDYPWQIMQQNDWALRNDFEVITADRTSQPVSATNKLVSPENIFIEQGAVVEHCLLNAATGPIYIGENAVVMEGSLIRGPFALCENSVVKMGSKIYGATTIGPNCVVAGEIKNAVFFANANKAHDGYLGDSVIGEWCNLGAGTTNSNVKNTAGIVKVWHQQLKTMVTVGLKCGLLMGDYSRAAINTSFNTGTVVGICCNIFEGNYPPKFVPDFSWGSEKYIFEKALQHIDNWKQLKGQKITQTEIDLLKKIYHKTTS